MNLVTGMDQKLNWKRVYTVHTTGAWNIPNASPLLEPLEIIHQASHVYGSKRLLWCNKAKAQIWQTKSSPPTLVTCFSSFPDMGNVGVSPSDTLHMQFCCQKCTMATGSGLTRSHSSKHHSYEFIKRKAVYLEAHILDQCHSSVPHMLKLCTGFLTEKSQYSPHTTHLLEIPKCVYGDWGLVSFSVSLVIKTAQNQYKRYSYQPRTPPIFTHFPWGIKSTLFLKCSQELWYLSLFVKICL